MAESLHQVGVNLSLVDTTIANLRQLYPNYEEDRFLGLVSVVAGLGISAIQFGGLNLDPQIKFAQNCASLLQLTHDDFINPNANNTRAECAISVVSGPGIDYIAQSYDAISFLKNPRLVLNIPNSSFYLSEYFKNTKSNKISSIIEESMDYALEIVLDNEEAILEASIEDAMNPNTKPEYLNLMINLIINEYGFDVINFHDNSSQLYPFSAYDFFMDIFNIIHNSSNPNMVTSAEFHDDFGQGVANSLMFIKAAIDYSRINGCVLNTQLKTSVAGIGFKAKNTDMFSLLASIERFIKPEINNQTFINYPIISEKQSELAVEIFKIMEIDIPGYTPHLGVNTTERTQALKDLDKFSQNQK